MHEPYFLDSNIFFFKLVKKINRMSIFQSTDLRLTSQQYFPQSVNIDVLLDYFC